VRFMPSSLFVASGSTRRAPEYDRELDATSLAFPSSISASSSRARCGPLGLSPAPIFTVSGEKNPMWLQWWRPSGDRGSNAQLTDLSGAEILDQADLSMDGYSFDPAQSAATKG
jgi:hypothetical protein